MKCRFGRKELWLMPFFWWTGVAYKHTQSVGITERYNVIKALVNTVHQKESLENSQMLGIRKIWALTLNGLYFCTWMKQPRLSFASQHVSDVRFLFTIFSLCFFPCSLLSFQQFYLLMSLVHNVQNVQKAKMALDSFFLLWKQRFLPTLS